MQEVRGSIPGRGTTDFCTLILFVYMYIYIEILDRNTNYIFKFNILPQPVSQFLLEVEI